VLPRSFALTDERRAVAVRYGLDPELTFEGFTAHYWGSRKAWFDWDQVWIRWCNRETQRPVRDRSDKPASAAQRLLQQRIAEAGGAR